MISSVNIFFAVTSKVDKADKKVRAVLVEKSDNKEEAVDIKKKAAENNDDVEKQVNVSTYLVITSNQGFIIFCLFSDPLQRGRGGNRLF